MLKNYSFFFDEGSVAKNRLTLSNKNAGKIKALTNLSESLFVEKAAVMAPVIFHLISMCMCLNKKSLKAL